jgi:hypothetical protein
VYVKKAAISAGLLFYLQINTEIICKEAVLEKTQIKIRAS